MRFQPRPPLLLSAVVGATALALGTAAAFAQSEIYKIVDPVTGAVEYTNQPKKGAVRMSSGDTLSEIPIGNKPGKARDAKASAGKPAGATANASAGTAVASVDAGTQRTRDGTRRQVLSDELASEEKLLSDARASYNNGRPAPLADEGVGSPRYVDRVKQLEKTLRLHERNVTSLKQELANLKS
ncbi:MAG: hypothetical protein JNL19_13580 [Burkholderiales bacterium]|nr:hypothetical protein [Burkholderiales bacterium]